MSWDFAFRGEAQSINSLTRLATDGSFVRLSQGYTHYETAGMQKSHSVILVHGFSVPYFIWDPTFEALSLAGLNPVRYDLFGRGYSDRPSVKYNMELYLEQLRELLGHLDLREVDLIGLSMGGAIAAAYTIRNPTQVRKLILIGPIGAEALPLSLFYRFASLPGIGELVLGFLGTEYLVSSVAADFFDPVQIEKFQARFRVQMQYRGFKRAILSSIRNHMLDGFPKVYEELARLDTPLMLIWGRNDHTVPFEQSRKLMELLPRASLRTIPDCGHIPHQEKPSIVNPMVLEFLQAS